MNSTFFINVIIFKPTLDVRLMFEIRPLFIIALLALRLITRSLMYVLEPKTCTDYLPINVFYIVVANKKYLF